MAASATCTGAAAGTSTTTSSGRCGELLLTSPSRVTAPPPPGQGPRKASSSHQEPWSLTTFASITSGLSRGPLTQSATVFRSSVERTVTPSQPKPRPIEAMSVGGNLTVSSGYPSGPKWCTSAPYASSTAVNRPSPIDWNAWVKQKPSSSGTDRYMLG